EYVGRAPLEGRDDGFLLASYRAPGTRDRLMQPDSGTMIAMNGPTPTQRNALSIPGMRQPKVQGVQVASLKVAPVSF
ncbi:hypothetical protein LXJ56_29640, partial [Escherichia coli]|nr:hypothetical protein [Escherichia coli]